MVVDCFTFGGCMPSLVGNQVEEGFACRDHPSHGRTTRGVVSVFERHHGDDVGDCDASGDVATELERLQRALWTQAAVYVAKGPS